MFNCPVEMTAALGILGWVHVKPKINKNNLFGNDFKLSDGTWAYKSFGLEGHNGLDFILPMRTPVYAASDGEVRKYDTRGLGYGKHIKHRSVHGAREFVYAHLDEIVVEDGQIVNNMQLIGYSGNTGFSTGPHLHFGFRRLLPNENIDPFKWGIRAAKNGYFGYVDPSRYMVYYKGTALKNTIYPL